MKQHCYRVEKGKARYCVDVEDLRAWLKKERASALKDFTPEALDGLVYLSDKLLASLQPFLPDKPAKEGPGGKKKKKEHRAFEYVMGFAKKSGSEGK